MSQSHEDRSHEDRGPASGDVRPEEIDITSTMVFPAPQVQVVPDTVWHVHVEVLGGPMDGLNRRVPGARMTLGRGTHNDLALSDDPMVSTLHAAIVREGRHYWLEDQGSRNGTFIGDQRISERTLIGPGTNFTLGQTLLVFMPR